MKKTLTGISRFCRGINLLIVAALLLVSGIIKAQLPTAQVVASQMGVGWNLGNALEVTWAAPSSTTQGAINAIKAAGFNTVRIPVAWFIHSDTNTCVIDPAWMAQVKQVVDYCMNANMYAIINIHWDRGWLENNCTTSAQTLVNSRQQKYWTQIANYFNSYNEHLIFASANEPNVSDATGMSVLLSYHQTFVNAVRATGGNNSSRTLIIQGPSTSCDNSYNLMNTMPTDPIANRMMVEVHYYAPWQFCGLTTDETWGSMFYYWGSGNHSTIETSRNATWGEESEVERELGLMKTKFADKGIPVLIGEFGAIKRDNPRDMAKHIASREYFNKYVVSSAKNKGMIPVYWDNGGADFGIINHSTGAITDQGVVTAIMQGAGITPAVTYVTITNRATGLLIDGMGRTVNGDNCGQYANSGSYNQQWVLETSGTYIKIKNRATGLYLDGMGRTASGSLVGQYASGTSNNQLWQQVISGSYTKLRNVGTGLYIDGLGKTANGSDLGQYKRSNSNNQLWTIAIVANSLKAVNVATTGSRPQVELYPNPFTTSFNLKVENMDEVTSVSIFDLMGKQVETISPSAIQEGISLGENLSPNMYIVRVNGSGWSQSYKIIKK